MHQYASCDWLANDAAQLKSTALRCLEQSEERFAHWALTYAGPLDTLEKRLVDETRCCIRDGTIRHFLVRLQEMADRGREIMQDLGKVPLLELPPSDWEKRDILTRSFRLMANLQKGIIAMDCRRYCMYH
jgi:hypothetical protein